MGCALTPLAGHEVESEVGFLGCALTILAGHEIESEDGVCIDPSGGS